MSNLLYRSDCKGALKELVAEGRQVDLIYLDPPFNSSRIYNMIYSGGKGKAATEKVFQDKWTLTSQNHQMVMNFEHILDDIKDISQLVKDFLKAWIAPLKTGDIEDQKMLVYLIYMTERLALMRQILKPTGSIYFHCDPTASHYIKIIMDGIFGRKTFKNEIIWRRTGAHNKSERWGPVHDVLLFYSRSSRYTWNNPKQPYMQGHVDEHFEKDNLGYKTAYYGNVLTGSGVRRGESGKPWKGFDPSAKGRHWAIPRKLLGEVPLNAEGLSQHQKLDLLHYLGIISIIEGHAWPGYERRIQQGEGPSVGDIWAYQPYTEGTIFESKGGIDSEVSWIKPRSKEHLGYPTQKPLGLLDRVIKASCPDDGIVLDPFCGCGTALISAIQNKRSWIGIDISYQAIDIIKQRIVDVAFDYNVKYEQRDGSPETLEEYTRLDPYQKQDWLIQRLGGFPNPRKSGDGGVDGDMTIHLGMDDQGNDQWNKIVFSVKTGKQCNPEMIRELKATMQDKEAAMGVLILDAEPSERMEKAALRAGQIECSFNKDFPASYFKKVQIITSSQIIDGLGISSPPSMKEIKMYRESQNKQLHFGDL